jgi:hypothetical protein
LKNTAGDYRLLTFLDCPVLCSQGRQAALLRALALTRDASESVISGYINHGRGLAFDGNSDDIHALQSPKFSTKRSAITAPRSTAAIVEKSDRAKYNFSVNCRGIWLAILNDESELPSIGPHVAFVA